MRWRRSNPERERRREIRHAEQEAVVATSLAGLGATLPFLAVALDRSADPPLVLVVAIVLSGVVLGGVGLVRSVAAYGKLRRLRPGRGLRAAVDDVVGSRRNLIVLGIIVALLAVVMVAG